MAIWQSIGFLGLFEKGLCKVKLDEDYEEDFITKQEPLTPRRGAKKYIRKYEFQNTYVLELDVFNSKLPNVHACANCRGFIEYRICA